MSKKPGARQAHTTKQVNLTLDEKLFFRNQLREARAVAARDAEAFDGVLHALERLGTKLLGQIAGIGDYKDILQKLAVTSPLGGELMESQKVCHTSFGALYDQVRIARNDALHHGAVARQLTRQAVEVCLVMEDALGGDFSMIGQFMVRQPVCAQLWQPVSFVRQIMLAESFSYLPLLRDNGQEARWCLISEYAVARYVRGASGAEERKRRLATTLGDAIDNKHIDVEEHVFICLYDVLVNDVLARCDGKPTLVTRSDFKELVGIVTPFDLL